MNTMHLFAGVGGGLLCDLILGHRAIVAVEWDKYACQVLRQRAADGWFPDLRVWEGDVRLFDPSEYAGSVDCIHAGFPCQDISVAGKQAGVSEGTRSGLYREVLRIADVVRPRFLFLENVSAILSNGLGTALADVAAMGYDSRWLCIRASDVGAPHHRDRWFLLADANLPDGSNASGKQRARKELNESRECRPLFCDADSARLEGPYNNRKTSERIQQESSERCEDMANTVSERQQGQRQPVNAIDSTAKEVGETVDAFYGGQPGFWATESNVGRVANGIPNRVHRLKGLGNAQVPIQAATAFRILSEQT